jgi:ribonuclease Z
VCESTFADADVALARDYGHLTAGQAGQIAAASGARLLVLTHFSQRYETGPPERLRDEAAAAFTGEIVLAADLDRIPVPKRARDLAPQPLPMSSREHAAPASVVPHREQSTT